MVEIHKDAQKPNEIDLLISMRKNSFHPVPVKRIDEMTLYEGPFDKIFGDCDANLKFEPPIKSCPAKIMEATPAMNAAMSRTAMSLFCEHQAQTFRAAVILSIGCSPSTIDGGKEGKSTKEDQSTKKMI